MKVFLPIFIFFALFGCKNNTEKNKFEKESETSSEKIVDSVSVSEMDMDMEQKEKALNLKRKELIEKKDQKAKLGNLVISKSLLKEGNGYSIDFKYPYLNQKIKPQFENFNEYISKYYLDAEGVEKQILEALRHCDSLGLPRQDERHTVDYKIYNLNDALISVLFYKENHYTGALLPSYSFDCLNFDLERGVFMNYEDFFNDGTEEELRKILNELLNKKINSGEFYYDCWEISSDDFFDAKNNFVINDEVVEYYFDDCVICPSYTGTYSIKIPLEMLMPVLRRNKRNPLFP